MGGLLSLKFPTYNSQREIWISAVSVAALVYLFLAVFQPFGTYNYTRQGKFLLLAPYAFIALFAFVSGDYAVSKYFSKWNWQREILKNVSLLFLCSVLNYLYSIHFVNGTGFDFQTLFYMILFTYSMGIPICLIYMFGKYGFIKPAVDKGPEALPAVQKAHEEERTISILPLIGDGFSISTDKFLYARSEGNYCHVFYWADGRVNKELIRIPLKKLEEQITCADIVRCHRSYILNTRMAIAKQGNAQGFKISLKHGPEKIPVSRKYLSEIAKIDI